MKRTAWLAAAAALMAATPAGAQHGYLGANYNSGDVDFLGLGSADVEGWRGEGEVGWTGGGWGGQIGGSFGNAEFDGGGDSDYWTANAHLYWDGGSWKIGGVVATINADDFNADETAYGIEAMFDISPNSNIWGDVTFGEFDFFGFADFDTWNLDVGGNFYSGPNVRFGGYLGTGNLEVGSSDFDSFSWGLNTEFRPWSAPVSITLGYNSYEVDDLDSESSNFNVGARWNFGGGTLQDRNNSTPFSTSTGNLGRFVGLH